MKKQSGQVNKSGQANKAARKRITIPEWLRDLQLEPRWMELWRVLHTEPPDQLRKRVMNQLKVIENDRDLRERQQGELAEIRRLRQEEAKLYLADLTKAKLENLGRIQPNLLQTLQSMMATMEGNSRAVHALAAPIGGLLERLRQELGKADNRKD